MTDPKLTAWEEVRDVAVVIAEDRLRRGVLTAREIRDALDEAYRAGQESHDEPPRCPPDGCHDMSCPECWAGSR